MTIEKIKDAVLKILEAQDLPNELQEELVAELSNALFERASLKLAVNLTPEELEQLNKLSDPNEVESFLRSKIDNFDEIVKNAFKEALLDYKKALKKQ